MIKLEVKINESNSMHYGLNSIKTTKNNGTSFSDILNQVTRNSKNVDTTIENINIFNDTIKTGNELIDKLPNKNKCDVLFSIGKLNQIFDIDILGDPSQFIKKDLTINMPRILSRYGNNVTASELTDLGTHINTLMKNGLISNEDYFYTLKWIETKQQVLKIKMQSEDNMNSLCDSILKPKDNDHSIHNPKLQS